MAELLPRELWELILTNHLKDLNALLRLRLVSKSFYEIVLSLKFTSLAVPCYRPNNETPPNWQTVRYFSTNELIKNSNVFIAKSSGLFQNRRMIWLLASLRVLYIESGVSDYGNRRFSLKSNLRHLKHLEQLQFDTLHTVKNRVLYLPNLRTLCINHYENENLTLKSKKLEAFKTKTSLSCFSFVYPEKIKLLAVEDLKGCHNEIEQFKNLEQLIIRNGNHNRDDLLHLLPQSLASLKIKEIDKDKVLYLLKQKKMSRRLNLKIYLSGILIETNQEIEDFFIENDAMLVGRTELILSKYRKLSDICPWIHQINYSVLSARFGGKMPSDFFSKFTNIRMIAIDQPIVDVSLFGQFVRRCQCLEKLRIESSIGQATYDHLHEWCSQLTTLTINDPDVLDLDFVFNHKKLLFFTTNQEIQPNKLFKFETLPSLLILEFKYNGKDAEIRNQQHSCRMMIDNSLVCFDHKNGVFNFLKVFVDD